MKLDVSDLFDHLYEVASFARVRFNLCQADEAGADDMEWDQFCSALSDQLFLPACASRVFSLLHIQIPPAEIKSRIITERSPSDGTKIHYVRYQRPDFCRGPCFNATLICRRPRHALTLWLGTLPPHERDVVPPAYPKELDCPRRYYAHQSFGFLSRAPHTFYYEFHGDWLLRQVDQYDASFSKESLGGKWMRIDDLTEIPQEVFENVWDAARTTPVT